MDLSWTVFWMACISLNLVPPARSATESTSVTTTKEYLETPAVDLGALLDAVEGAVVTLVAGATRLVAHRAVLAAHSPAFEATLSDDTPDASDGHVDIRDVEGPVLRQLLVYMYTLQAPQMSSMAPQLLAAADKYGVSGLKAACEQQLVTQLAVDNAASLAVLAVRHSSCALKEATVSFIKANFLNVVGTQDWADMLLSHPNDMNDVIRVLAEPPVDVSSGTPAATYSGSSAGPQAHSGNTQTPVASTPATAASLTSGPDGDAVSWYSTPAATGSGSTPGRQSHGASSETSAASTPAMDACPSTPLDGDLVSYYRSFSAYKKDERLIEVAKKGFAKTVRVLLELGADVRARDNDRYTALHQAAERGHTEVVRCLLDRGAEVDAKGGWQFRPLHKAAMGGHAAVVRLLIAASADVNARDSFGRTPLHWAAGPGRADTVAALLEAGADRAATDDSGNTPLSLARKRYRETLPTTITDLLTQA